MTRSTALTTSRSLTTTALPWLRPMKWLRERNTIVIANGGDQRFGFERTVVLDRLFAHHEAHHQQLPEFLERRIVAVTADRITGEHILNSRHLAAFLAALLMAAPVVLAQTAAQGSPPPAASGVDPASIQALKDMGSHLQSLTRFRTSTTLTGERVLADGQKLQHIAYATLDVERPNKLHARMWSARSERELFYDGKTFTIFVPAQKYYSSVEFSGTNAELVDALEQRFGVEIPLSDLFKWGTPEAPVDKIESAMNAGGAFLSRVAAWHASPAGRCGPQFIPCHQVPRSAGPRAAA